MTLIDKAEALAILAPAPNSKDGLWAKRKQVLYEQVAALPAVTPTQARIRELEAERDRYLRHLTAGAKTTRDFEARAEAAEAKIKEMALDVLASSGQAHEAYEAQLAAEARIAALTAQVERLRGALSKLHHAVCGETGFAACVRLDSGKAYPWPALDEADAEARAAITEEPK
jgi:hypothetical protein